MELYLQFGSGMMEHCRHLLAKWGGGTVILSPRDLNAKQLRNFSAHIKRITNGQVLLDPQFYLPHADHVRLCSHEYWPSDYATGVFFQGDALRNLVQKLVELNVAIGSSGLILPGLLATTVDDAWLETERAVLEVGRQLANRQPIILTIALDADTTQNHDHITSLLEAAASWEVEGVYLVCEHPSGNYLVQEPNWLANVLDLVAGLRLLGMKVILGYCNHQMLAASLVQANAICSGTWMNVRSFPPDKFRLSQEEEIRQRATWYYCPQALSEYKIPFLDIAQRQGLLPRMAPPSQYDGGYVNHLFGSGQPSTIGFSEQPAFRHYLHALHEQTRLLKHDTYDEALAAHHNILDVSRNFLNTLISKGVRGQQRDFVDSIDVNRAAITLVDTLRAPMLRRQWKSLS